MSQRRPGAGEIGKTDIAHIERRDAVHHLDRVLARQQKAREPGRALDSMYAEIAQGRRCRELVFRRRAGQYLLISNFA